MSERIINVFIENLASCIVGLLFLPLTFLLLKMFLGAMQEWAALPEFSNEQIIVMAVVLTFARM